MRRLVEIREHALRYPVTVCLWPASTCQTKAAKRPFTNLDELSSWAFVNRTAPACLMLPLHQSGRVAPTLYCPDHQSPQANWCRDSGSSRIGRPVSATSAFTTAGAIGGSGGSPTPPIASPDSMMIVSMRSGDCVMRSSG